MTVNSVEKQISAAVLQYVAAPIMSIAPYGRKFTGMMYRMLYLTYLKNSRDSATKATDLHTAELGSTPAGTRMSH